METDFVQTDRQTDRRILGATPIAIGEQANVLAHGTLKTMRSVKSKLVHIVWIIYLILFIKNFKIHEIIAV